MMSVYLPLKRPCFLPPAHAKGRGVFHACFKHVSDQRFRKFKRPEARRVSTLHNNMFGKRKPNLGADLYYDVSLLAARFPLPGLGCGATYVQ